jgi:cytochrome c553
MGNNMKKSMLVLSLLLTQSVFASEPAQPAATIVGDATAGQQKSAVCGACHGVDGNSLIPTYPNLAGQHASYIQSQLVAFKAGQRKNVTMEPMAAPLSEQDQADLAVYFSGLSPKAEAIDAAQADAGLAFYRAGNKASGVAACMSCHGPSGEGNAAAGFPSLKGQKSAYVLDRLKRFKAGDHSGSTQAQIMADVASRMSDADMQTVSNAMPGLK